MTDPQDKIYRLVFGDPDEQGWPKPEPYRWTFDDPQDDDSER